MRIDGVSVPVNDAMNAVTANVLREDGLLLRTCEHGIRHPVGHLHVEFAASDEQWRRSHEKPLGPKTIATPNRCDCDGCCEEWNSGLAPAAVREGPSRPQSENNAAPNAPKKNTKTEGARFASRHQFEKDADE